MYKFVISSLAACLLAMPAFADEIMTSENFRCWPTGGKDASAVAVARATGSPSTRHTDVYLVTVVDSRGRVDSGLLRIRGSGSTHMSVGVIACAAYTSSSGDVLAVVVTDSRAGQLSEKRLALQLGQSTQWLLGDKTVRVTFEAREHR